MNQSIPQHAPNRTIVCPPPDRWREYAQGELSEEWIDLLSEHLEICSTCESTLSQAETESAGQWQPLRTAANNLIDDSADKVATIETLVEQVLAQDPFADTANSADATAPATTYPPIAEAGTQLGPYTLLENLGAGGMGIVFKARHEHTKREVALKLLNRQRSLDAQSLARFRREMEATGRVEHRQVVQALDAGEIDGQAYLAMEYVRGETFDELVVREGRLDPLNACRMIADVAKVLSVLHGRGIVHRDLKPSNLMLDGSGEIRILDLGLIRLLDAAEGEASSTGTIVGTADYIAPEQSLDSREADARSDVYSLGCTLYCLLHGRPPFADPRYRTFTQKALAHVQVLPERLDRLHDDIPAELATIVARMLAKQPNDRYQSAADVADALHAVLDPPTGEIIEATPATEAWAKRLYLWWMIPTAIAIVTMLAFMVWRPDRSLPPWDVEPEEIAQPNDPQPKPPAPEPAPDEPPENRDPDPLPSGLAELGEKVIHWPASEGGNNHYYLLSSDKALWTDAKTLAEKVASEGYRSYLVSITSTEENVLIANKVLGFSPAWIGLTDDEQHGGSESEQTADPTRDGWHWLSDEPVKYVSWGPGRPQHFNQQDYVFMYSGGAWDDGDNFALPYIVEIEKVAAD